MRTFLRHQVWPAIASLAILTLITGFVYPAAVTAVAQAVFPSQANGSYIVANGTTVGSSLIGQAFSDPKYFWGRPSAAGVTPSNPAGYDSTSSGGSNLGPTSKALIDRVTADAATLKAENPNAPIPVDLLTTSASGLDPDITPAGALFQVPRVAKARNLPEDRVRQLVVATTEDRFLGTVGEPHVNVLKLNLALDALPPAR